MICNAKDCGELTSGLHLCEEHRAELRDLLDGVDFLIVNLDPAIQAGKVVKKPGGNEGGNGTRSASSRPPVELDANQIRYMLWELPRDAYIEARDNPDAGRTLFMARIWVTNGRKLVYGSDDDVPTNPQVLQEKLAEEVPAALRIKPLIDWLHAKHGLNIKASLIRQWDKRGKITRNNQTGFPTYDPATVAIHALKEN